METSDVVRLREQHIPRSYSISYSKPLHIVQGKKQYLYDKDGSEYIDVVNNVAHVGHCHPSVIAAAHRQLQILNTNTRYYDEHIGIFARQLLATFPPSLSVVFFTNSGSEANDLAIRLAKAATGGDQVVVIDHAYHGNTNACIDISPYKFNGKGGKGCPALVHVVEAPDTYRGKYTDTTQAGGVQAGVLYANEVKRACERIKRAKKQVAAFFAESVLGCAGQIFPPPGYLAQAFEHVRAHGGLCVADEVQVGFGRVGSAFWGFQLDDPDGLVCPDIVTLGKPMGNGWPLGAVVTTRAVADRFHNGMEYFNTFGGSTASMAVGKAVLDVIANERLQHHAAVVGAQLLRGLQGLMTAFPLIGDVRGRGLFLGVELVKDRRTREPAAAEASYIADEMREKRILISTDGPLYNVLKLKPPMYFSLDDAAKLVNALREILTAMNQQHSSSSPSSLLLSSSSSSSSSSSLSSSSSPSSSSSASATFRPPASAKL